MSIEPTKRISETPLIRREESTIQQQRKKPKQQKKDDKKDQHKIDIKA